MNLVIILSGPNIFDGILSRLSDNDLLSPAAVDVDEDPGSWILGGRIGLLLLWCGSSSGRSQRKTREIKGRN